MRRTELRSDGHLLGAPDSDKWRAGRSARAVRNSGTERAEELSSKTASITLGAGETVRIETGGGGFGAPAERVPAALAADLRGGKVSSDRAHADYFAPAAKKA